METKSEKLTYSVRYNYQELSGVIQIFLKYLSSYEKSKRRAGLLNDEVEKLVIVVTEKGENFKNFCISLYPEGALKSHDYRN